jgi:D-sedoheptulose 7-phosphate isomerase
MEIIMERRRDIIAKEIEKDIDIKNDMLRHSIDPINKITEMLVEILKNNGKIVFFGNGGSAADAQHFAGEFIGRFGFDRAALPAIALNADTSVLTCIGNDYGYDSIFARQVEGLVTVRDAVVGITTSGKSNSVIMGLQRARSKGASTILFSGLKGESLRDSVDASLIIPSTITYLIQQGYMTAGHIICNLVEQEIFS